MPPLAVALSVGASASRATATDTLCRRGARVQAAVFLDAAHVLSQVAICAAHMVTCGWTLSAAAHCSLTTKPSLHGRETLSCIECMFLDASEHARTMGGC